MPFLRRAAAILLLSLAVVAALAGTALAGPFDLDPAFGTGGIVTTGGAHGGRWTDLHVLPDGSFLAAGEVGNDRVAVGRFDAQGVPDPTFAAGQPVPGLIDFGGGLGAVTSGQLLVLGDGSILAAWTAGTGSAAAMRVGRLTAAGALDTTFGASGIATVTTTGGVALGGFARQSSGAIVLAGAHTFGGDAGVLARLTPGGATDTTFGGTPGQIRVLLGGAPTRLDDVAIDGSDRIVVTGRRATGAAGLGQLVVARMTAGGATDATYGTSTPGFAVADLNGAPAATYDVEGRRIRLSGDGHALVAATVQAPGAGAHLVGLAQMTPNGALDPGFGTGGTATQDISPSHVTDIADLGPLPGGGFGVAGRMTVGSTTQVALAGFHADGSPDLTLNPGHGPLSNAANIAVADNGDDEAFSLALTPAGRLLVGGRVTNTPRDTGFLLRVGGSASAPIPAITVSWPHTVDGRPVRPGQTVTFDATGSHDTDGSIASYAWDLDGDGQTDHSGPTATMTYNVARTVGVLLRVTDDTGLTASTGATFVVDANHAPGVAMIDPAATLVVGKSFTLTALAGDSDGSVASYAWDLDGNGSFETGTGATAAITTHLDTAGSHTVRVRATDDEGVSATDTHTLKVGEGPCLAHPVLHLGKAVIVTQGTAQAGQGCFQSYNIDKSGIRTTTYTTNGHFRVNGLEVDTLGASKAVLVAKHELITNKNKGNAVYEGQLTALTLKAPNVHVEGTSKGTDFAFIDGAVAWDLAGATIGGFKADKNAGIGGLPLKVAGEPALKADGTSTVDVTPGTPPELLGKTPDQPIHAVFGPAANAAALGAFSFKVDTIPLGVITLGPVTISYDGAGRWDIAAKASMPIPVPTTLAGKLALVNGKVKMVDLQFTGAITAGPLLITHVGLTIDFGPKVEANPNCIKHVGLEDITPYAAWDLLDKAVPGFKAQILAQNNPNQVLFHKIFADYHTPTFALCGSVGLSVAKLVDANVGFGFARYASPLPNVFFFHGDATLIQLIHATIDAEITTDRYVHLNAEVKGGYPEDDPWIGWKLGLDFEYFKSQYNAEAYASITVVPLDFTAGARLLASSKGIVACLTIDTPFGDWHPGGGAEWGHWPTLYFMGCDVNDYKVVIKHALSGDIVIGPPVYGMAAHAAGVPTVDHVPAHGRGNEAGLVRLAGTPPSPARRAAIRAAAAQAAPDAVVLPAGLPGTVMAFKGAGAPPHVILHGPMGETIDTGSGREPMRLPGVAALKNPRTGITEVVIAKPSAGRWTVEVAPDSSRLVEALQADGAKPATITGRVVGSSRGRRLQYRVSGLAAGQHVDFTEVGASAGSVIGRVTHDGSGTLAFRPSDGAAGRRDIQALVTGADGFVAERRKLGTYRAPAPPRPAAARRLSVKRAGHRIVLRWPRDKVAKTTQVDVRTSSGLNITRIVRSATLRLPAPPAGTTLKVTLTGTSRTGVLGRSARFTRRLPRAPAHRTTGKHKKKSVVRKH
jgi:uncharacterized delta-60 repeat protein